MRLKCHFYDPKMKMKMKMKLVDLKIIRWHKSTGSGCEEVVPTRSWRSWCPRCGARGEVGALLLFPQTQF